MKGPVKLQPTDVSEYRPSEYYFRAALRVTHDARALGALCVIIQQEVSHQREWAAEGELSVPPSLSPSALALRVEQLVSGDPDKLLAAGLALVAELESVKAAIAAQGEEPHSHNMTHCEACRRGLVERCRTDPCWLDEPDAQKRPAKRSPLRLAMGGAR